MSRYLALTAGLLAALTLKKRFPDLHVRIVRDPSIGIIGVGEGSTPKMHRVFDRIGVEESEWIMEMHAEFGMPNAIVAHAWFDRDNTEEILARATELWLDAPL